MSARGSLRREQMEEAGVALLAEAGWPAVTARAVAERSGANPGLIHYHYGGLTRLHHAIAARAVATSIRPMVEQLVAATDVWDGVLRAIRSAAGGAAATRVVGRLTSELMAGAFRDDDVRELVRDELRGARTELGAWISSREPGWSAAQIRGTAVLITALLDGLVLQHLLDEDLDPSEAAAGLTHVLGATPPR